MKNPPSTTIPGYYGAVPMSPSIAIQQLKARMSLPYTIEDITKLLEYLAERWEILVLIEELRASEAESIEINCQNPDPEINGLPLECVTAFGAFTDWEPKEFRAPTLKECLLAAVKARREFEADAHARLTPVKTDEDRAFDRHATRPVPKP